jgi:dihydrofolate reductase
MSNIVVSEFITLDGVIEGPGEEPGFDRAGWAFKFDRGAEGNTFKFEEIRAAGALLLGRVTYEGFAAAWPTMEGTGEFGEKMNSMAKYVVSTTLAQAAWNNSTIIKDNVPDEVRKLKERVDGDILINGSCRLVQTLIEHDLVDEYRLMIFPIVLGAGKRLFATADTPSTLRLANIVKAGDAAILTYQPARANGTAASD